MNNRALFGSPDHIQGDWLEGEVCKTPSCRTLPTFGAEFCRNCEDRNAADEYEDRCDLDDNEHPAKAYR